MPKQRVVDTSVMPSHSGWRCAFASNAGTSPWWLSAGTSPLVKPEGRVCPPKTVSRAYKVRISTYRRLNLHTSYN